MPRYLKIAGRVLLGLFTVLLTLVLAHALLLRPRINLELMAPEESFVLPTSMTFFPGSTSEFVVTEKAGKAKWFAAGSTQSNGLMLDLTDKVYSEGWEEGLLSLAFDPEYAENRYVYVFYSVDDPKFSRLSRFQIGANNVADRDSELLILQVPKARDSHNGGMLQFGKDGYLYVSIGDSYRGETAKDLNDLRGSLLRIDVRNATAEQPYTIPNDNPFYGSNQAARAEIIAYGFRNPWRFSLDHETQEIYVGDVGDNDREEVNRVELGAYHGWPDLEGDQCYPPSVQECEEALSNSVLPLAAFSHEVMRSVIGGFVYRGDGIPWLRERYVFAAYFRGIFSISVHEDEVLNYPSVLIYKPRIQHGDKLGEVMLFSSMSEDAAGELYATNLKGAVYKLTDLTWEKELKGFFRVVGDFR
jgi:glucose/arabinose dehydrogenase